MGAFWQQNPKWFVGVALGAALFVYLVSHFLLLPFVLHLPSSYYYSADVLSLDNFYDVNAQQFQGEQRSVTTFLYRNVGEEGRTATIENVFDVRTVAGEPIFSVAREYGVDKYSWQHVAGGDKERNGYLFAPRGVGKNKDFTYWHVNYDTPLTMTFQNEEVINGLKVYHFVSDFQVDQTNDLSHLEGVPEEMGINLDVSLSLWVEPVTGMLVKYEDKAIAYYYDQKSKKRLYPWNTFSNRYTKGSIDNRVSEVKKLKKRAFLASYGPMSLVLLISAMIFLWWKLRKVWPLVLVGAVYIGGLVILSFSILFTPQNDPLLVGISRWVPVGNPAYEKNIQGFKDALKDAGYIEGKDVVFYEAFAEGSNDKQKEIARDFVARDVDLVYSLTTPGTLVMKDVISSRPVVFSIVTYPIEAGIVESLERSGNNLVGTRNWVPAEDQLAVFREIIPTVKKIGFIHRTGETNSTIQLREMEEAAQQLDIEVVEIAGATLSELMADLESVAGEGDDNSVDSLYSACDTLVQGEAENEIVAFAKRYKIPSFSCNETGPRAGDLVGTVADFYRIGYLAGQKAVLVLEGATPSSLPTYSDILPSIYLNETTAEELGVVIPQNIYVKAREIIN